MKKEFSFSLAALIVLIMTGLGFWYLVNLSNKREIYPPAPNHTATQDDINSFVSSTPILVNDTRYNLPSGCEYTSADNKTSLDLCDDMDLGEALPGLSNPFILTGTTTVFENQFSYEVIDELDNLIIQGQAYANSPDMGLPGPFVISDYFDKNPATSTGRIELIEYSAKDGERIVLLAVPVHFYPVTDKDFSIYFNNNKKDPEMLDCSNTYSVKRDIQSMDFDVSVAIHSLLQGPTNEEIEQGFFSNLPDNVNDPTVTYEKDRVILDFDETLESGVGGSCRVTAIRSQIEQTAESADPYRREIVISIDGRTEDILQP
ncbi:GerMN domain-containing protein [Patescibacteria group bacterium]|nr:GerMN domain-containing protein [Patescibacteria group bacterium]